ncbi:ABC transporter substrate-binding protein [uncultured Kiloniella sp.]|uniref:ABC transporter substrate-binding protein n=1 Tax=uncultured Kiloniella sp. TaxID=1133091 RepID=UPI0026254013|nr:ABC transporter substrate-binding protein [uncultured Kiloniella sp.]
MSLKILSAFIRKIPAKLLLVWVCLSIALIIRPVFSHADSTTNDVRTNADLVFGMSTALSGQAAELGKNMCLGIQMRLERENSLGGIDGRKIRLIAWDDGYEPDRTIPNIRNLINYEDALAIIGNVGTPTAISAIPIVNEEKTLFFAPFTGAGVLRKNPPDRYVINYRASYAEETSAMVNALIEEGGLKPEEVAFFTQRDSYGDAGFTGGINALKRHGLESETAIVHSRYERNTLVVESALADVLLAEPTPKAIIMVGAYAPSAKFIKLARMAGLDSLFLNVSFVGSAPLAKELGKEIKGVIVTQVVPYPEDLSVPIVRAYHDDISKYAQNGEVSFGSLEGYIAMEIMIKALHSIEGEPDRENIIDALENLGEFDIGLGQKLFYNREHHQASHKVWPTSLRQGEFVPFDWKNTPSMLVP